MLNILEVTVDSKNNPVIGFRSSAGHYVKTGSGRDDIALIPEDDYRTISSAMDDDKPFTFTVTGIEYSREALKALVLGTFESIINNAPPQGGMTDDAFNDYCDFHQFGIGAIN